MSLHPDIEALLDMVAEGVASGQRKPLPSLTPAQARADFDMSSPLLDTPAPEAEIERILALPMRDGAEIEARLYAPAAIEREPVPVLLYMHGGGFVIGSLESHESLCRDLADEGRCAVLSIAYRLAPEHKFPTAFEDAVDALAWIGRAGAGQGLDATRVAVGGDSAGGTLAAALAIAARDDASLPRPRLQVLAYPGLAPRQDSESYLRYGTGHLLEAATVQWFFAQYLRSEADRDDWRFAPLACHDLRGVAPALVLLAEYDPLVDEGQAYVERLRAGGVETELQVYPGMVHEFLRMGNLVEDASRARSDIAQALRAKLAEKVFDFSE